MDCLTILLLLPLLLAGISISVITLSHRDHRRLPPGPYPFPIIGNIFQLGDKPHQALANLSRKYGPLMSLKLGYRTTIVVSSPKFAKEMLQKHDLLTSSRTIPDTLTALSHDKFSVGCLPVGEKWRDLRKVMKEHMFSRPRLEATMGLRQKKVQELLDYANKCYLEGEAVDIGSAAFTTTLNLISNTMFSVDLAHHDSSVSQEFKDTVMHIFELAGKPNLADYFPVLKWVDPQHMRREMARHLGKMLALFNTMIDQRLNSRSCSMSYPTRNDVLEGLIELIQGNDSKLSWNDIKHSFQDIFNAGTDTTSSTLEFAMAELLHNPEKMEKVRVELAEIVGKNKAVEESDISRLPYLKAVVKETLRLHPAAPLLVPHKAKADIEVNGYMVPKNAQILINVWAMGRDPSIWNDPNSFIPERFLESEVDFRGQDFELIPFGSGRRICPGLPLADRMVHLMLGSLIHSFDWKLEKGMEPENINMNEKFGLSLHKEMPLKAIPTKP